MLSDQAMAKYIKLDERQGPKAFNIPNIEAFVVKALPKYFPDMNQWGSFQKQLSNYGYKKKDRHKDSGTWILRNKNPSDVLHQCKDPPLRKTLPERHPTATTPTAFGTVLEPRDQLDLYSRVDKLENELNATRSELSETRALLSEARNQLQAVMNLVRRISVLPFGDCSLHSMAHPGPAVETPSNGFPTHEESSYANTHYEPPSQRQINSYNGTILQDSFSHRGTDERTDNTVNPALLVQEPSHPQPPSFASSANPEHTLPRAEDQQPSGEDPPQNIVLCGWMENGPNSIDFNVFDQQPNVAPPTGSQNSAPNPASAFADQMSVLPRSSNPNSPRPSGRRAFYGGSQPVPLPQPPAHGWRLW
ncbi:hypothetical protein FS837_011271 [Tulasnella sp. UAMH 9824]|nr:hypothetical protein FS837_011271 [Tulasnella sp. UAMH 9824]